MTDPASLAHAHIPVPSLSVRIGRSFVNTALFLITCAAVCFLLRAFSPFPPVPGISPKWEWFKDRRDEFDLLFVGSSRFFHQVIPQQFDAAVARDGGPAVRSFNFSYDAAWPPESYYLLRQILTLRPARLKWVFIELQDIDSKLEERNESTLRTSYWHDLRHTRMAFAHILESGLPGSEKGKLLVGHARIFFQESVNLGRGAPLVQDRLIPTSRKSNQRWEDAAGYRPGPAEVITPEAEKELLGGIQRMKRIGDPVPVRGVFREALRDIVADVRRAGIEPIFVLTPTINVAENYTGIPGAPVTWIYNDPDEFPALYDPANRYDAWHLNHQGAVAFTALLAARFAELTRTQR